MTISEVQALKPDDIIYLVVLSWENMPTAYRVLKNTETWIELIDLEGVKRNEDYRWIKKVFNSYEDIGKSSISLNRDGLPYPREHEIIVRKDEIENAEYYI